MQIWGTLQILGPVRLSSLQTAALLRPRRPVLVEKENHPVRGYRNFYQGVQQAGGRLLAHKGL